MTKVLRFTAAWCGPCRILAPMYQELIKDYEEKAEFITVDVDKQTDLASKYSISSIPAVVVEQNGEVLHRLVGVKTKDQYKEIFNNL